MATEGIGILRADSIADLSSCDSNNIVFVKNTAKWYAFTGGEWVENPSSSPNSVEAFPVGSIFTSVDNTNPATTLGYGTWVSFGAGRTLVGVDTGQTEFDTVEKTGGAKTHTLTVNEMPSHTHVQDAHSHTIPVGATDDTAAPFDRADAGTNASGANATTATGTATATNQNTGGGAAHNNLQPFITVYFWRRAS